MDFIWIAIFSSLAMGIGTALFFVYAVKGNHFQNVEDAKYQVFWSDMEDLVEEPKKEGSDGEGADKADRGTERRSDH